MQERGGGVLLLLLLWPLFLPPRRAVICQLRPGLLACSGAVLAGFPLQLKPKPTGAPPLPRKLSPVSTELQPSSLFPTMGFFYSRQLSAVEDARCLFACAEPAQNSSAPLGLMMCRCGLGPLFNPGTQVLPACLAWRLGEEK